MSEKRIVDTSTTLRQKFKREDLPENIPIPNTDKPTLIVYKKSELYKVIDISDKSFINIGRSPEADLWLAMETVSKAHSIIERRSEQYFIKDLGSKNGTFVNTEVLSPDKERVILDGDVIKISAFYLCCHIPQPSPQSQEAPEIADDLEVGDATMADDATVAGESAPPTEGQKKSELFEMIESNSDVNLENDPNVNTIMAIRSDKKMQEKFDEAEKIIRYYIKPIPEKAGHARLAKLYKPLTQIGGDFYSIFDIDEDHLGVALGDVAGHGMPAALIMIACMTMLELHGRNFNSPAEALSRVNEDIAPRLERGKFVTVFYGILNTKSGEFRYCSAGHPPPYLFNTSTGEAPKPLAGKGPGFGIFRNRKVDYEVHSVQLERNDRLLLYTDCVLEAGRHTKEEDKQAFLQDLRDLIDQYNTENFDEILDGIQTNLQKWEDRDECFGEENLCQVIQSHPKASTEEILRIIYDEVKKFSFPQDLDDDTTLITVDWQGA